MPNTVLETRVRAAYRAKACAAAVAAGSMTFSMGAGIAITLSLNAAYISALAVLPAAQLAAFLCQRALRRQAERASRQREAGSGFSRALYALLALTLLSCSVFMLAALMNLAELSLLSQARTTWIAGLSLAAVGLCALSGGTGVSRLCFALRFFLPAALLLCSVRGLCAESYAGLFPLLGAGAPQLGLSALAMLGAASPVLMLMLPPDALRDAGEEAQRCAVPKPGFFIGRVTAGTAMGIAMLLALTLCNSYESLRTQGVWGQRMVILSCSEPSEDLFQMLLTLAQVSALTLGAVGTICAAEQSAMRALPKLGAHRLGLGLCMLLCAAAIFCLIRFGFVIALRTAPFLLIPLAVLTLFSKRM